MPGAGDSAATATPASRENTATTMLRPSDMTASKFAGGSVRRHLERDVAPPWVGGRSLSAVSCSFFTVQGCSVAPLSETLNEIMHTLVCRTHRRWRDTVPTSAARATLGGPPTGGETRER